MLFCGSCRWEFSHLLAPLVARAWWGKAKAQDSHNLDRRTHFDHIKDTLAFSPSVPVSWRGAALKMCVVSFDAPTGCLCRKVAELPGRSHRASRSSRRPWPLRFGSQKTRHHLAATRTLQCATGMTGCRDDQQATVHSSSAANMQELQIATLRLPAAMTRRVLPRSRTVWHSIRVDIFSAFSLCPSPCPVLSQQEEEQKQKTSNRNRITPHRVATGYEPTFPVATDSFIHQTTNLPWHQISLIKHVTGPWCAFSCKHVQAQDFSEFSAVALSAV